MQIPRFPHLLVLFSFQSLYKRHIRLSTFVSYPIGPLCENKQVLAHLFDAENYTHFSRLQVLPLMQKLRILTILVENLSC